MKTVTFYFVLFRLVPAIDPDLTSAIGSLSQTLGETAGTVLDGITNCLLYAFLSGESLF